MPTRDLIRGSAIPPSPPSSSARTAGTAPRSLPLQPPRGDGVGRRQGDILRPAGQHTVGSNFLGRERADGHPGDPGRPTLGRIDAHGCRATYPFCLYCELPAHLLHPLDRIWQGIGRHHLGREITLAFRECFGVSPHVGLHLSQSGHPRSRGLGMRPPELGCPSVASPRRLPSCSSHLELARGTGSQSQPA